MPAQAPFIRLGVARGAAPVRHAKHSWPAGIPHCKSPSNSPERRPRGVRRALDSSDHRRKAAASQPLDASCQGGLGGLSQAAPLPSSLQPLPLHLENKAAWIPSRASFAWYTPLTQAHRPPTAEKRWAVPRTQGGVLSLRSGVSPSRMPLRLQARSNTGPAAAAYRSAAPTRLGTAAKARRWRSDFVRQHPIGGQPADHKWLGGADGQQPWNSKAHTVHYGAITVADHCARFS